MQNYFRKLSVAIHFVLISCLNQQTNAQEIDSLEQTRPVLDKAGKNSLVIFDIDETLTYPTHTIRQKWFFGQRPIEGQAFFKKFDEHIKKSANPGETAEHIMSIIYLAEKSEPVEKSKTESIIKELQDRGIKVIALTASSTRTVGRIPSMPAWRFDKLAKAGKTGINLNNSFAQQEIALSKISTPSCKPCFFKGILSTDGADKGPILGAFLDAIEYKPDQIIFFDDLKKQVTSVQNEAKTRNIPCHGFIYKAAEKLPRHYDAAVLDLQLEHLINHDEYITEEQARELLKK